MRSPYSCCVFFLATSILWQPRSRPPQPPSDAPKLNVIAVFAEPRRLMRKVNTTKRSHNYRAFATSACAQGRFSRTRRCVLQKKRLPRKPSVTEKAREEDKNDHEATQLLGLSYYLSGRPAEAIPYLEKVQSWFPRANVDAAYILGIAYIQTKDYPHSRAAFARMFDVPPDSAAAYLFTARMLLRQEFDPVAEEYAQKSVALDPKFPLAHALLGELHLYKSRVPEAIAEFEKELA